MINSAKGLGNESSLDKMSNINKDIKSTFNLKSESNSDFAQLIPPEPVTETHIYKDAEKSDDSNEIKDEENQDTDKARNEANVFPFWMTLQTTKESQNIALITNKEAGAVTDASNSNKNSNIDLTALAEPNSINEQQGQNLEPAKVLSSSVLPSLNATNVEDEAKFNELMAKISQDSSAQSKEPFKISSDTKGQSTNAFKNSGQNFDLNSSEYAQPNAEDFEPSASEIPPEALNGLISNGDEAPKTNEIPKDFIKAIQNENVIEVDFTQKNEISFEQSAQIETIPQLNINNLDAIAAMMVKKAANGEKSFFVRLDPPELGKIEVELKFGHDNKVTAIIKADTEQALNELLRSAKDLAYSLTQSGIEFTEKDLSFTLNNNFDNSANNFANQKQNQTKKTLANNDIVSNEILVDAKETTKPIRHEIWGQTRISIIT